MEKRKASLKQEKRVAKEIGGRTVLASGALWFSKADIRNSRFLCEAKTTEKSSYRLYLKTWEKIYHEANRDGLREPVMCIELNNGETRLAVVSGELGKHVPWGITAKSVLISEVFVEESGFMSLVPIRFMREEDGAKITSITIMPWEDFLEGNYEQWRLK